MRLKSISAFAYILKAASRLAGAGFELVRIALK
jgi:hypothetical protein